jgi:agmatinase
MKTKKTSFLGVDSFASPYVVLPIPYERTVSYGRGTKYGPEAILRASLQIEDMDDELLLPYDIRTSTLPAMSFEGVSDKKALEKIYKTALRIVEKKHFLLSLGGEHTITFPLVKAVNNVFGCLSVLQIDAHFDLHNNFRNKHLSHACVMRRIWEIDKKINIVPVGIRSIATEEYNFVQKGEIPFFHAKKCFSENKGWISDVIKNLKENVYITFDVDALDPSIVPATGTPEPDGLGWLDVLNLLKEVCKRRKIIAADFVELAPIKGMVASEYTVARLILRLLMYHKHSKRI